MRYNQTHYYYYYYDGVNLLFVKKDNAIDMRYLYDNEGNVYCAIANDGLPYWHHTDIRGSVTNVLKGDSGTSSSPTLIRSYLYNAYGDTNYTTFSGGETFNANPYLAYTGAILDQETGLYYLMSRYYDPKAGSFISQDSYKGEGDAFWHLYAYCDGDPVNYVDRGGQFRKNQRYNKTIKKRKRLWGAPIAYMCDYKLEVQFTYLGQVKNVKTRIVNSKRRQYVSYVSKWKIHKILGEIKCQKDWGNYWISLSYFNIDYLFLQSKTYYSNKLKTQTYITNGTVRIIGRYINPNIIIEANAIKCGFHWRSSVAGGDLSPYWPYMGDTLSTTIRQ